MDESNKNIEIIKTFLESQAKQKTNNFEKLKSYLEEKEKEESRKKILSFLLDRSKKDINKIEFQKELKKVVSAASQSETTVKNYLTNLQSEINALDLKNKSILEDLQTKKEENEQFQQKILELQNNFESIERKNELAYLTNKISEEAIDYILKNPEFISRFSPSNDQECVVISIDIRRSTELMLKAKSPKAFTEFISNLTEGLKFIITKNHGVFDKFTGDGILAYFPDFFSGQDKLLYAIKAADECHIFFQNHYKNSRKLFTTVLKDTGLGIGIDLGTVNFARISEDLTVVGNAVVYACRLSSTEANTTLLNQSAFDDLNDTSIKQLNIKECEINIKHEGVILTYKVSGNWEKITTKTPLWLENTSK